MQPRTVETTPDERGWPAGYFDRTFGAIDDESFVRAPQGKLSAARGARLMFLLDTNVCVRYLRGKNARVRQRLAACPTQEIRLCSVVLLSCTTRAAERTADQE